MQVFLFYISCIFGVLPLLYILLNRKAIGNNLVFFKPFILLSFFSTIYEFIFSYFLSVNSNSWFRAYLFLEFICVFYFFYKLFEKQDKVKKVAFGGLVFYLSLYILLLFFWQSDNNLKTDSLLSTYSTFFVIVFSVLWFQKILINFEINNLFNSSTFIIISGLLSYYTSTFFLFIMSDYIFKQKDYSFIDFWQVNVVLVILFRISLLMGIKKCIKS